MDYPNEVWTIDFKGWFKTADGRRCDPLTVEDACTRYLLLCKALKSTNEQSVKAQLEQLFRMYGLPQAIRSDNGPPFATPTLGGLSRLAIWWIRLGIMPERIKQGNPQENGRHERFHLTLKQETATPPKTTIIAQQRAFTKFVKEYNNERPHESLNYLTPAELYEPSPRPYPKKLPEVTYQSHYEVRTVKNNGEIKWKNKKLFMSETLYGERIGLKQITDRHWAIFFGPVEIGILDDKTRKILRYKRTEHFIPGSCEKKKP